MNSAFHLINDDDISSFDIGTPAFLTNSCSTPTRESLCTSNQDGPEFTIVFIEPTVCIIVFDNSICELVGPYNIWYWFFRSQHTQLIRIPDKDWVINLTNYLWSLITFRLHQNLSLLSFWNGSRGRKREKRKRKMHITYIFRQQLRLSPKNRIMRLDSPHSLPPFLSQKRENFGQLRMSN